MKKKTFKNWRQYIKYQLRKSIIPDHSETIQPLRFNWELYGRYLEARK